MRFVIYKAGWKRGLIVIQQSEAAEEGNLRREMPDADVNFLSGDIHNLPSQDPVGRVAATKHVTPTTIQYVRQPCPPRRLATTLRTDSPTSPTTARQKQVVSHLTHILPYHSHGPRISTPTRHRILALNPHLGKSDNVSSQWGTTRSSSHSHGSPRGEC